IRPITSKLKHTNACIFHLALMLWMISIPIEQLSNDDAMRNKQHSCGLIVHIRQQLLNALVNTCLQLICIFRICCRICLLHKGEHLTHRLMLEYLSTRLVLIAMLSSNLLIDSVNMITLKASEKHFSNLWQSA